MGLFKKKAGGTFFGNLLRAGASKATGGMLGTGANRIELGETKTNAELSAERGETTYSQYDQRLINDLIPPDRTNTLYWVVGGLVLTIAGVIAYTQGVFKGTGYKRKGKR